MASILRPADQQLANIIDKLAEFVARNGPEFENMTKIKQQNNAKFSFLQPGKEYFNYYQFKVEENRRKMMGMQQPQGNNFPPQNNMMQSSNQIWSNGSGTHHPQPVNVNIAAQIEVINTKQMKLKEQIIESEKNLNAQHQVLLQQQKTDIEDALSNAQMKYLCESAQENEISLSELDEILQPIIDSCTKDSIANGKSSILQQATNSAKRQIISQYILKNVKKNADDLKNCLESVVIPMFCNATISANEEQKEKLSKLLNLWASKANFFDSCAISKLQSPPSSLQEYHTSLLSQYAAALAPLNQAMKKKFDDYRNQHKAFVEHATNQLTLLEAQKQTLEQQNLQQQHQSMMSEIAPNPQQQMIPSILSNVNILMNQQNRNDASMLQNMYHQQQQPPQIQNFSQQPQDSQNNQQQYQNFALPPPNFSIPDFSRPPPAFFNSGMSGSNSNSSNETINTPTTTTPFPNSEPLEEVNLTPTMPYYELPAGLMVPLIRLEDFSYHGIDPEKIQLPPPSMPTDKLLGAIEAFYAPPSHERPRDNEGWEKLGLYEYFKIKNSVRKQKEEAIMRCDREKSKSPSPIPETLIKPSKKTRKRVYRSESPEKKSKSRSASPEPAKVIVKAKKQRSKSPNSPLPYRFNRNNNNNNSNRDNTRNNRKRSVTPPSFSIAPNKTNEFIDEGNKGHVMLKKMGWESGGLGLGNQGITQPISGGEVRDRVDMYKGVGMNMNDPYENFRKNRSNNFITRMKSRTDKD